MILNEQDQVLLVCRARGVETDKWTLPGGKPDAGETFTDAVKREVLEEIGLQLILSPEAPLYYASNDWDTVVFRGTALGELSMAGRAEHKDANFVAKEELDSYDIAFGHELILNEQLT